MKKSAVVFIFFIWIFILNSTMTVKAEELSANILILNSYHSGFKWTDDQTSGILSVLSTEDKRYQIAIEYMDWKRFPTQKNLKNVYATMKNKYADQKMDVIICTDDKAFEFALKNRKEIFSDAPIVFSGVTEESLLKLTKSKENWTGVQEVLNPKGTIEAALSIDPEIQKLYLIYDNTESGQSVGEYCREVVSQLNASIQVIPLNNTSSENIIKLIADADKNSMVLMTTYTLDLNGSYLSHEEFCRKISEVSPVPVYDLYDFSLEDGIFGGNLIVGKLQGTAAGNLALRIINGEQAGSIPVVDNETNQLTFNYQVMKKYSIRLKDLPLGSQVINAPFSFFKTYQTLVTSVLLVFIALLSLIAILVSYTKKIKGMQKKLKIKNEELTQLYEELAASEEEMRTQYVDLVKAHDQLEENNLKLQYLVHHDTLTGLYNRLYLYEEIEKEMDEKKEEGALLFIDLDNFKYVNDVLGHSLGDELLKEIVKRLLTLNTENNVLIRLDGDEFVYYMRKNTEQASAKEFAENIIKMLIPPFSIRDNFLTVSVSIGIALFPKNGTSIDALLRSADMAMYQVKNSGKNGYFFFNKILNDEVLERITIETCMKRALLNQEFLVCYQPQVMSQTNELDGFEALIRWNSPELGMLSPLKFIGIAEETGFIISLGEWILRSACFYIKQLNEKHGKEYNISVNISVIQLLQDNFLTSIEQILHESGLNPEQLELEM